MLITALSHVHSEWSYDGNLPLDLIARIFKMINCRVLLMTEHDKSFNDARWELYRKACEKNSTENLLVLPGIEYSDPTNTIHILVWGDIPFLGSGRQTEDVLIRVKELGGISVFAHPMRKKAFMLIRPDWAKLLHGMEEWNRKFDGLAPSEEAKLLIEKFKLVPFYGLDFHQINQFAPLAMKMIIDGRLTYDKVLFALENRYCYPQILGMSGKLSKKIFQSGLLLRIEKTRRFLRGLLKS